MNRKWFGFATASILVSTASAVTFSGTKIGTVGDPNGLTVESWDFGINMEDPEEWLFSSLNATLEPAYIGRYSFAPIEPGLEPPSDAFDPFLSTFFSTAAEFPNVPQSGGRNYIADIGTASRNEIELSWAAGSEEDGIGPSFTLFRLAISHSSDELNLTLNPRPGSELVATLVGTSDTTFEPGAPMEFSIYTVPEPATAMLLMSCGLLAVRRR